jgi:hypothetical protein
MSLLWTIFAFGGAQEVYKNLKKHSKSLDYYLVANGLLSILVGILYSISWHKKTGTHLTLDYGVTISKNFNSVNVMWIISMVSIIISIFLWKKIIKETGEIKLKKDEGNLLKMGLNYNYIYLILSFVLYLYFIFKYSSYM